MNITLLQCESCHRGFDDDGDIVFCPECGSPMHRSCYTALGHCANEEKHADGFAFEAPVDKEAEEKRKQEMELLRKMAEDQKNTRNRGIFISEGEYGGFTSYETGANGEFHPAYRVIDPKEKMGNYTVEEYGAVIQKKKARYIPRFFQMEDTGRKTTWNWAACFFPILWAFYRKMYGLGIALVAITCLIPLIFASSVGTYYQGYAATMTKYMMSSYEAGSEDAVVSAAEQAEKELASPKYNMAIKVLDINSYIQMFISIIMGLFGTYLYKRHVEKLLQKAEALEDEKKAAFLKRKGGASIGTLLLGLFLDAGITYLIVFTGATLGSDLATLIGGFFK